MWKHGAIACGALLLCITAVPALPSSMASVDSLEPALRALDSLEEDTQSVGNLLAARSHESEKGRISVDLEKEGGDAEPVTTDSKVSAAVEQCAASYIQKALDCTQSADIDRRGKPLYQLQGTSNEQWDQQIQSVALGTLNGELAVALQAPQIPKLIEHLRRHHARERPPHPSAPPPH